MNLPPLTIIGLTANVISMAVGLGLLTLIIWQSRRTTNLLFGLFLLFMLTNAGMVIVMRLSPYFPYPPEPWLYGVAATTGGYGVLMFVFTAEFTDKHTSLTRIGYFLGAVAWVTAVWLAFTGRLMINVEVTPVGETVFDFTTAGYIILGVLIAFEGAALINLLINPTKRSRALIPAVVLLLTAAILDSFPFFARLPVNSTLTAISAILMGRVILEFQLFNPLAQLNRELGRTNEELEHANQMKSQFLATMSHEFRTPLNSIIGYTELVMEGIYGPVNEEQTNRLDRVLRNGHNLLTLINDILDLSKIEAGRMELSFAPVELRDVLKSVHATIQPLAEEQGLYLRTSIADDVPRIEADSTRITQILTNLLSNAIKFTEEGGVTVNIQTNEPDDRVIIEVSDTGIGISEDKLDEVFEEFRQADNTPARKYKGTGLGLAISLRLARMHGGTITVESEVGEGSTFTVTLPIKQPTDQRIAALPTQPPGENTTK